MRDAAVPDRARSFAFFVIAAIYFFFAQLIAIHSANGLVSGEWTPLVERAILLFLLLVGYAAMGRAFEGQSRPLAAMGLTFRTGWQREIGLGAALGWGMLIASILPTALLGGLIVSVWTGPRQWLILLLDLLILAVAALAEEVAFRGYPFQRLVDSIGPIAATLLLSILFGVAHMFNPGANTASVVITIFAGWLLAAAYLRTRALWFSWGWHFAWNVSMGVLFGLPISGLTRFSPIIQSNTVGPEWITGGDYGPEASVVAGIVILGGLIAVFVMTRGYAHRYARPAAAPNQPAGMGAAFGYWPPASAAAAASIESPPPGEFPLPAAKAEEGAASSSEPEREPERESEAVPAFHPAASDAFLPPAEPAAAENSPRGGDSGAASAPSASTTAADESDPPSANGLPQNGH
jgi:hypothetical protein